MGNCDERTLLTVDPERSSVNELGLWQWEAAAVIRFNLR